MNVQNFVPMEVQGVDGTNEQTVDSNNIILQIDDGAFNIEQYDLELSDNSTFVLHKKVPSYEVPLLATIRDASNVQNADLTNSGLEQNVVKTSLTNGEGSVTSHIFQNVVDDCSTDQVQSEVVWLPVSPKQNLQDFLDFSTTELIEGNESIANERSDEENLSSVNQHQEIFKPLTNTPNPIQSDNSYSLSTLELSKEWLKNTESTGFEQDSRLFKYVASKINLHDITETEDYIKSILSNISFQISIIWKNCGRNRQEFFKKNALWLNGPPIKLTPKPFLKKKPDPPPPPVYTNKPLLRMRLETNGDVYKFLRRSQPPFKAEMLHAILISISKDLTEDNNKLIKFCQRYVSDMKFKWMTADYKEDIFQSKFEYWLRLDVRWPAFIKAIFDSKTPKETVAGNTDNTLHKFPIDTLERALTKKCSQDVSKVLHRLLHHPNDAARMRQFIADSKCNCKPLTSIITKQNRSTQSPEKDPLNIESEISTNTSSLPLKKPLKRLYKPSGAHLDMLKGVLNKLKGSERKTRSQPSRTETQPSPNTRKLEFGPVLDKLLFIKSGSVAPGTQVKLSNKSATVVKITNSENIYVLAPTSKIERGAKVTAPVTRSKAKVAGLTSGLTVPEFPLSLKFGVRVQAPPHGLQSGVTVHAPPHGLKSGVTVQDPPHGLKSGVTVQAPLRGLNSGVTVQAPLHDLKSGVSVKAPPSRTIRPSKSVSKSVQSSQPSLNNEVVQSPPRICSSGVTPSLKSGVKVHAPTPRLKSDVTLQPPSSVKKGKASSKFNRDASQVTRFIVKGSSLDASPPVYLNKIADAAKPVPLLNLKKATDIPNHVRKKAVQALLSEISSGSLKTPSNSLKGTVPVQFNKTIPSTPSLVSALLDDYEIGQEISTSANSTSETMSKTESNSIFNFQNSMPGGIEITVASDTDENLVEYLDFKYF